MHTLDAPLTVNEAVSKLKDFSAYQFCAMTTKKECKLVKKHRLTKEPTEGQEVVELGKYTNLGIGYTYEKSVNNRRVLEGNLTKFNANELPFGEYLPGSKTIITHKGQFYLRLTMVANTKVIKEYELNGIKTNYDAVAPILNSSHLRKPKAKSQTQNVENDIKVIAINIKNIKSMSVNGQVIEIKGM